MALSSVYKVPDSNVQEGNRITNKPGMSVQTYVLNQIGTLSKYSNGSLDAVTAGLYLSDKTPGTKWYKVTSKSRGEMFIEGSELGKTIVFIATPGGVKDSLGRSWKTGQEVYSAGANIRKTPTTKEQNIWKGTYTGLVGKFQSIQKNVEGEWIKTDTGLYIYATLAQVTPYNPGTGKDTPKQDNNETIVDKAKNVTGSKAFVIVGILALAGALTWALTD